MGKKLYVGNLSYTVESNQLTELFNQIGPVDSVNVITDRESGRSKGFAFVEMSENDDAQNAITKFNGSPFEGRALSVSEAKPRAASSDSGTGSYRSRRSY